jgi:hypothetical protein
MLKPNDYEHVRDTERERSRTCEINSGNLATTVSSPVLGFIIIEMLDRWPVLETCSYYRGQTVSHYKVGWICFMRFTERKQHQYLPFQHQEQLRKLQNVKMFVIKRHCCYSLKSYLLHFSDFCCANNLVIPFYFCTARESTSWCFSQTFWSIPQFINMQISGNVRDLTSFSVFASPPNPKGCLCIWISDISYGGESWRRPQILHALGRTSINADAAVSHVWLAAPGVFNVLHRFRGLRNQNAMIFRIWQFTEKG